ncbi:hypothetical protein HZB74_02335 [Candidatus Saccharibacteria bacterium]|nr:hypothetical protein [Candidatus Saccharibacteria bacterium]
MGSIFFQPSKEQLEFIGNGEKALAEKFDRHTTEFGIVIPLEGDNSFSDKAYIGYIGLRDLDIKPGDTVKIGNGFHSVTDPEHGDNSLRVFIPKSF